MIALSVYAARKAHKSHQKRKENRERRQGGDVFLEDDPSAEFSLSDERSSLVSRNANSSSPRYFNDMINADEMTGKSRDPSSATNNLSSEFQEYQQYVERQSIAYLQAVGPPPYEQPAPVLGTKSGTPGRWVFIPDSSSSSGPPGSRGSSPDFAITRTPAELPHEDSGNSTPTEPRAAEPARIEGEQPAAAINKTSSKILDKPAVSAKPAKSRRSMVKRRRSENEEEIQDEFAM